MVLDTHVWIWWASEPDLLSARARKAIGQAVEDKQFYLSSISCWEIAMLVEKGRLKLSLPVQDWIALSEGLPFVNFVPVNNSIGVRSVQLPGKLHNDPADRIIIATAISLGAAVVTADEKIKNYNYVKVVW